ncbi:hypothetical protein ACHAW6_004846, partial [Cyclotella cf. meneghiniana]
MLRASQIDPSKLATKRSKAHTISTATHGHHQAAEPPLTTECHGSLVALMLGISAQPRTTIAAMNSTFLIHRLTEYLHLHNFSQLICYYEVAHTPGLWKHISCHIKFTLTVDDFGIKYIGKEHANHLLAALQKNFILEMKWAGKLYCGITLDWDYEN